MIHTGFGWLDGWLDGWMDPSNDRSRPALDERNPPEARTDENAFETSARVLYAASSSSARVRDVGQTMRSTSDRPRERVVEIESSLFFES